MNPPEISRNQASYENIDVGKQAAAIVPYVNYEHIAVIEPCKHIIKACL